MNGFIKRRALSARILRAERSRGQHAERSSRHRSLIREDVAEEIVGHDHVELLRPAHELHDVLAAAKPASDAKTVRLSALDGYAAEIPLATIAQDGWVLAVEAGGNAFGIGDFGPLYTVRPLAAGKKRTDEEDAKWVFSLYYIELMP